MIEKCFLPQWLCQVKGSSSGCIAERCWYATVQNECQGTIIEEKEFLHSGSFVYTICRTQSFKGG